MTAFVTACIFVVLAEMGDKTQLLAMAFAMKFPWRTVLGGVLAATLANHLLAVAAGAYLGSALPLQYVQVAASLSFIGFGLWTIRGDTLAGEDRQRPYGPFWTVAVAFFLAEMGDKTQFATIALAARLQDVLAVWMGSTTGMMLADGLGIAVGGALGRRVGQRAVKWFAAAAFIAFGVWGLYDSLRTQ